MRAPDLVRWHWEKAGTIELVHRGMKDELGAGVLPSQRFGANVPWFRITAISVLPAFFHRRPAGLGTP